MTIFIEGLDLSIKAMMFQYRQDNKDVFFLGLVNYANAHSLPVRSRENKAKKVTIQAPPTLRMGSFSCPLEMINPKQLTLQ